MSVAVRVLTEAQVETLLDPDALVEALAGAMAAVSAGTAAVAPRAVADAGDGLLLAMAAHVPEPRTLAAKLVTLFPGNAERRLPTHNAVIAVFDPLPARPPPPLDGIAITAARTAAGSALATRALARADAGVLAVLGTGVQGRAHARAVVRVRPFREVRVAGRRPEAAQALAEELAGELAVPVSAASFEEAATGADVVCATTHSGEPVVRRGWLAPGAHVTSVGWHRDGSELDGAIVRDALVVVESRDAALDPASGARELAGEDDVDAELGEILLARHPGRTAADQLTLYKSVGVAAQDAAAAALVLAEAERWEVGQTVEL